MENSADKPSLDQPILLVEDTEEDREATVRAFRRAGVANSIHCCENGDSALDYLHNRGAWSDAETYRRPGVVLLDLNMPGTDGREVLEEAKAHPELKSIPFIVLTTSKDDRDIDKCYALGANSYVAKPVNASGFFDAIARLKDYWYEIVVLPKPK